MPFDGTDFQPEPKRPNRTAIEQRVYGIIFVVVVVSLLLMPISMASLVDIIAYLSGK